MDRDRTMHALTPSGNAVVRYDRAGKWFLEGDEVGRRVINLEEAVRLATQPGAVVFYGLLGGGRSMLLLETLPGRSRRGAMPETRRWTVTVDADGNLRGIGDKTASVPPTVAVRSGLRVIEVMEAPPLPVGGDDGLGYDAPSAQRAREVVSAKLETDYGLGHFAEGVVEVLVEENLLVDLYPAGEAVADEPRLPDERGLLRQWALPRASDAEQDELSVEEFVERHYPGGLNGFRRDHRPPASSSAGNEAREALRELHDAAAAAHATGRGWTSRRRDAPTRQWAERRLRSLSSPLPDSGEREALTEVVGAAREVDALLDRDSDQHDWEFGDGVVVGSGVDALLELRHRLADLDRLASSSSPSSGEGDDGRFGGWGDDVRDAVDDVRSEVLRAHRALSTGDSDAALAILEAIGPPSSPAPVSPDGEGRCFGCHPDTGGADPECPVHGVDAADAAREGQDAPAREVQWRFIVPFGVPTVVSSEEEARRFHRAGRWRRQGAALRVGRRARRGRRGACLKSRAT